MSRKPRTIIGNVPPTEPVYAGTAINEAAAKHAHGFSRSYDNAFIRDIQEEADRARKEVKDDMPWYERAMEYASGMWDQLASGSDTKTINERVEETVNTIGTINRAIDSFEDMANDEAGRQLVEYIHDRDRLLKSMSNKTEYALVSKQFIDKYGEDAYLVAIDTPKEVRGNDQSRMLSGSGGMMIRPEYRVGRKPGQLPDGLTEEDIKALMESNPRMLPPAIDGGPSWPQSHSGSAGGGSSAKLPKYEQVPDHLKEAFLKYSGAIAEYDREMHRLGGTWMQRASSSVRGALGAEMRAARSDMESAISDKKNGLAQSLNPLSKRGYLTFSPDFDGSQIKDFASKVREDLLNPVIKANSDEIFQRKALIASRENNMSEFVANEIANGNKVLEQAFSFGLSNADFPEQATLMVASIAAAVATQGKSLGVQIPLIAANTAANVAMTTASRESESQSEFADHRKQRFDNYIKGKGLKPVSEMNIGEVLNLVDESTSRDVLSRLSKGESEERVLFDMTIGIESGAIPVKDRNYSLAAAHARTGAAEYFAQQHSNMAGDLASTFLSVIPMVNTGGKVLFGKTSKAAYDFMFRNRFAPKIVNEAAKKTWDLGAKAAASNFGRYASIAGARIATGIEESFEESQQEVAGQRYIHGTQGKYGLRNDESIDSDYITSNRSIFRSIGDGYSSWLRGGQAALGYYGDEEYLDKGDVRNSMLSGFIGAMINPMGAISTASQAYQTSREIKADKYAKRFVDGVVANRLDKSFNEARGTVYANADKNSRGNILHELERIKSNPPEGIDPADIEEEIKIAKAVFSLSDNKRFNENISGLGSTVAELASMYVSHATQLNQSEKAVKIEREAMKPHLVELEKAMANDDNLFDALNEVKSAMKSMGILNLEESDEAAYDEALSKLSPKSAATAVALMAKLDAVTSLARKAQTDLTELRDSGEDILTAESYRDGLLAQMQDIIISLSRITPSTDKMRTFAFENAPDISWAMATDSANEISLSNSRFWVGEEYSDSAIREAAAIAGSKFDRKVVKAIRSATRKDFDYDVSSKRMIEDLAGRRARTRIANQERLEREAEARERAKKESDETSKKTNASIVPPVAPAEVDEPGEAANDLDSMFGESKSAEEAAAALSGDSKKPDETPGDSGADIFGSREFESGSEQSESFSGSPDEFFDTDENDAPKKEESAKKEGEPKKEPEKKEPEKKEEPAENKAKKTFDQLMDESEDAVVDENDDEGTPINAQDEETSEEVDENLKHDIGREMSTKEQDAVDEVVEGASTEELNNIDSSAPGLLENSQPRKFNRLVRSLFSGKLTKEFHELTEIGFEEAVKRGWKFRIEVHHPGRAAAGVSQSKSQANKDDMLEAAKHKGDFAFGDESTYDNPWDSLKIDIIIQKPGAPTTYMSLRTPMMAWNRRNDESDPMVFSDSEISGLKEFRDSILQMWHDARVNYKKGGPVVELIPTLEIDREDWDSADEDENGNNRRPVYEVEGLGFPTKNGKVQWDKVDSNHPQLAVGMGDHDENKIVTLDGEVVAKSKEGKSNVGNVYIVVESEKTKERRPAFVSKETVGGFSAAQNTPGSRSMTNIVIDLLLMKGAEAAKELSVDKKNNGRLSSDRAGQKSPAGIGITRESLLSTLFRFGPKTIVSDSRAASAPFLRSKQFYIDDGMLHFGDNVMSLNAYSNSDIEALRAWVEDNLTFSVNKNDIRHMDVDGTPDKSVSDVFTGLRAAMNYNGLDKIEIADGLVITKADLDLTWTAFLYKSGFITSDLADGVFKAPFAVVTSVTPTPAGGTVTVATKGGGLTNIKAQPATKSVNAKYNAKLAALEQREAGVKAENTAIEAISGTQNTGNVIVSEAERSGREEAKKGTESNATTRNLSDYGNNPNRKNEPWDIQIAKYEYGYSAETYYSRDLRDAINANQSKRRELEDNGYSVSEVTIEGVTYIVATVGFEDNGLRTGFIQASVVKDDSTPAGIENKLLEKAAERWMSKHNEVVSGKASAALAKHWSESLSVMTAPKVQALLRGDDSTSQSISDLYADEDEIELGAPREVVNENFEAIDIEKESNWIESVLGLRDFSIDVRDKLIAVAGNKQAMGLTKAYSIVLSKAAEVGTAYHEAFHRVSLLLMSPKERNAMYAKTRETYSETRDMSNKEVEEYLAEKFREYMLNNTNIAAPTKIKIAFRKIINFIRKMVGLNKADINRLFDDISGGVYKNAGVNKESLAEFKKEYSRGATKITDAFNLKTMNIDEAYTVSDALMAALFKVSGVSVVNSDSGLNFSKLKDLVLNEAAKNRSAGNEQRALVFDEIYEKFDSFFVPQITKEIAALGFISEEETEINDEAISGANMDDFKQSYTFDPKLKLNKAIKAFLYIIPEYEMVGGKAVLKRDPLTGLPLNTSFGEAFRKMSNAVASSSNSEKMMKRIARLSKTDPFFTIVAKRLADESENFKTKFYVSMKRQIHEYVSSSYRKTENGYDWSIRDLTADKVLKTLPKVWGSNLIGKGTIFTLTEDDGIQFNRSEAERILNNINKFSDTAATRDYMANRDGLVEILNSVGISVTNETIDKLFESAQNKDVAIRKYLTDLPTSKKHVFLALSKYMIEPLIKNDGKIKNRLGMEMSRAKLFERQKFSAVLAEAHAAAYPSPDELMAVGADGALLYSISEPNYVSDIVDELNDDLEAFNRMKRASYNSGVGGKTNPSGSVILTHIQNAIAAGRKPGIKIKTFVKMFEDGTSDRGVDYAGMSPVEDYLFKMAATQNDMIVFPTMADKVRYYLLSGVKLLTNPQDTVIRSVKRDGSGKATVDVDIPTSVYARFEEYMFAEFMAIQEAYSEYVKYVKEDDPSGDGWAQHLKEVYHYRIAKDKDGRKVVKQGNGLRFRHMNFEYAGMNINDAFNLGEDRKGIEGTAMLIEQLRNSMFSDSDKSRENRRNAIKRMLVSSVEKEVAYMNSLGIVSVGSRPAMMSLKSDMIGNNIISKFRDVYNQAGVRGNDAETSALVSAIYSNVINTAISIIEYEKIFSKDPAFHKNDDAKIKRHSTMMSTGAALRVDFPVGHEFHNKKEFTVSELLDIEMESLAIKEITTMAVASYANDILYKKVGRRVDNLQKILLNDLKPDEEKDQELAGRLAELQKSTDFSKAIEEAKVLSKSIEKGYKNVNEVDATVFISPAMYRSIKIRLGEWEDWMDEAFEYLESEDESWLSDDEKAMKVAKLAMQPLKMIYVGPSVNNSIDISEDNPLDTPVINKMALFGAFRFTTRGNLKAIYDRMHDESDPIDMMPFNSAVKAGNSRATSPYKDGELNDMKNIPTTKQQFRYLRKQLVTDAHEGNVLTLGSQINKMAMSNIEQDRVYGNALRSDGRPMTGAEIISEWVEANIALSNLGVNNLSKKFGFKRDEATGKITVDQSKLYTYLKDAAGQSGMPASVIYKMEKAIESDETILFETFMDDKWIESRIMSLIGKEVIDIQVDGGMYIQHTPFGVHSFDASKLSKGKMTEDEFKAKHGEEARMLNNGKPLLLKDPKDNSMQAILSINVFDNVIPTEIKSHAAKVAWLRENNLIGENSSPVGIGYRVPSQGLSSSGAIKIMDVTPSVFGDMIMLPSEFTKQTGSDFDIDKLFFARYKIDRKKTKGELATANDKEQVKKDFNEWKTKTTLVDGVEVSNRDKYNTEDNSFGAWEYYAKNVSGFFYEKETNSLYKAKYTTSIPRMDDTKENKFGSASEAMLQNKLIDLYLGMLTDENNVHETILPLDTATDVLNDNVLSDIESGLDKSKDSSALSFVLPSHQSRKRSEFLTGKNGVAPSALNNTHHVLTQAIGLGLNGNKIMRAMGLTDVSGIYGIDGVRILDWLNAMISAHVDVAKDTYIMRLNVNPATYNMLFFLLRAGFGKSTFYFLSQPAIKEYARRVELMSGRYGNDGSDTSPFRVQSQVLSDMIDEYSKKAKLAKDDKKSLEAGYFAKDKPGKDGSTALTDLMNFLDPGDLMSFNSLRNELLKSPDGGNPLVQLKLLKMFQLMTTPASGLASITRKSQIDTKKYGISFNAINSFMSEVEAIALNGSKVFSGASELFTKSFLYAKGKNALDMANAFGSNMLIRTLPATRRFVKNFMSQMMIFESNSEAESAINDAIGSAVRGEFYVKKAEEWGIDINGLFFGKNTLAKDLAKIKDRLTSNNPEDVEFARKHKKNFLLSLIAPSFSEFGSSSPDAIYYINGALKDQVSITKMQYYWSQMLESDDETIKSFARKLILYQFFSTGDRSSANLMKLGENDRSDIGLDDHIIAAYEEISSSDELEYFSDNEILETVAKNKWFDQRIIPSRNTFRIRETFDGPSRSNSHVLYAKGRNANGAVYPAAIIDTDPRFGTKVLIGDTEHKYFPQFVTYNIEPKSFQTKDGRVDTPGDKVLYRLAGTLVGEKILPVYVAVEKMGGRFENTTVYEYGLSSTNIEANKLPVVLDDISDPRSISSDLISAFDSAPFMKAFYDSGAVFSHYDRDISYESMEAEEGFESDTRMIEEVTELLRPTIDELSSIESIEDAQLISIANDLSIDSISAIMEDAMLSDESKTIAIGTYINSIRMAIANMPSEIKANITIAQMIGLGATADIEHKAISDYLDEIEALYFSNPSESKNESEVQDAEQGEKNNIEVSSKRYTRQSVENDSDTMYLFTDNAERTSAPNSTTENVDKDTWYYKKYKSQTNKPIHYGSLNNPTSAVIRGLNNAYPISTMSAYGTNWTDDNFELFKRTIDDEIDQIKQDLPKFSKLRIGNYRIGQGGLKAKLPLQHQQYLDNKLKELGIDNTQSEPKIINQSSNRNESQNAVVASKSFTTENDAALFVEDNNIETGTVIHIAENNAGNVVVINRENEDIRFVQLAVAEKTIKEAFIKQGHSAAIEFNLADMSESEFKELAKCFL